MHDDTEVIRAEWQHFDFPFRDEVTTDANVGATLCNAPDDFRTGPFLKNDVNILVCLQKGGDFLGHELNDGRNIRKNPDQTSDPGGELTQIGLHLLNALHQVLGMAQEDISRRRRVHAPRTSDQ
ncbi:hypothetical protein CBM2626_B150334 [Cupriavidus taiwanensis]|nr:hypothetical protein CBM2626_B150334 [Cupriavidus taiwanensis]